MSTLSCHSGVRHYFEANNKKFDKLYSKRAFVHWIVAEGIPEYTMHEVRENSEAMCTDMKEVQARSWEEL